MSKLGSFVWGIADQLRGVYKPAKYGDVILPFTILRRLDCLLEPTREQVRALVASGTPAPLIERAVRQQHGLSFYNTSNYDMARLKADPDGMHANLLDYTKRFSANIDVFERFKFDNEIATLHEKGRLGLVVKAFADIDLHPSAVSNADMGDLFEHLIRRFAEASNETAGEHFTPRDAIRLMVDLVFANEEAALQPGVVRSVYDPTAGTGGMLSVAEEYLIGTSASPGMNPEARLNLYGQEINDQSYAICKSDLIAKGQDPSNVRLGDTLAEDAFAGRTFDYCLSNPPYGVDWKASEEAVRQDRRRRGAASRFPAGTPKIGDGQMLFLSHLATKMRPVTEGGGRAAIVLNGSPLFNGAAESGESEIRRWLLEFDLVDAIVALPTSMFFNTGIATYVWVLDNDKPAERVGTVQLIDATSFFTKMRKNLGDKSREVSEADRTRVLELYAAHQTDGHSKVFAAEEFGFWTITVERPLRLSFVCTPERIEVALAAKPLAKVDPVALRAALSSVGEQACASRDAFNKVLGPALGAAGIGLTTPQRKALLMALGERGVSAETCTDSKGNPEPDVSLRDTENIPFTWGGIGGRDDREQVIKAYVEAEVLPHVPDAWVDHSKTKVGYEIPFTRHFYRYVPPRPLAEIDADLNKVVAEILDLLREVEQ